VIRILFMFALTLAMAAGASAAPKKTADAGAGGGAATMAESLTFTCTPDEKSKAAGAAPFEDTLDFTTDSAKSAALSKEGFAEAATSPKTVNEVITINVTFKKPGETAAYFIRAKKDGTLSGSLVRRAGTKTLRYTIGTTSDNEAAERNAPAKASTKPSDLALDPAVLRVNGGFVRLMGAQAAMADAGVNADKGKVAAILKAAGAEQNRMRTELLKGELTPDAYAKEGEERLAQARAALVKLLGADKAAAVEDAHAQPFTSAYVYLNQMRAALVESGGSGEGFKRADKAIYEGLVNLTVQAKQKGKLTPGSAAKLKDDTRAAVLAAIDPKTRERFERTFDGLTAYKPGAE
jgi:hypothetical protein